MTIQLIAGNQGKINEIKTLTPNVEMLDINLPEIQEIDTKIIVAEKLKAARNRYQDTLIVEDTSSYLDCMNG